jgi:hypothetical protein
MPADVSAIAAPPAASGRLPPPPTLPPPPVLAPPDGVAVGLAVAVAVGVIDGEGGAGLVTGGLEGGAGLVTGGLEGGVCVFVGVGVGDWVSPPGPPLRLMAETWAIAWPPDSGVACAAVPLSSHADTPSAKLPASTRIRMAIPAPPWFTAPYGQTGL